MKICLLQRLPSAMGQTELLKGLGDVVGARSIQITAQARFWHAAALAFQIRPTILQARCELP